LFETKDHTVTSSIAIITDCYEPEDLASGRPFSGTQGHILRGLCSQAGIELADCATRAVFPLLPPGRGFDSFCIRSKQGAIPGYPYLRRGYYLPEELAPHLARLRAWLERTRPNVVVALGNVPLWALTKASGIERWRGSPLLDHTGEFKVLATWHPSAIIKQWNLRPIAFMDLVKARRESEYPQIKRPKRYIHLEPTLADIEEFYHKHIAPAEYLAVDIETKADTITEIGFASSPSRALVIPFWSRARGNYWSTLEEERAAWEWTRLILSEKPCIGQNFQYDMQYLWRKMGIPCPGFAGDTMLLHHALQPEMKKGLGFLGSVYTDEPSWKFMRTDHSTMKKEDE
jgi:uracil-DNA glycosylase